MASFAETNRERMLEQLAKDPRVGGDKVLAAAALIRGSFVMMVLSGIAGAFVGQIVFGTGGLQFGLGLAAGYAAYFFYQMRTMGPPRVIGVMAVLTNRRILMLGSRKAGVVAEWKLSELAGIDVVRKGNLLVMGKIVVRPKDGDGVKFYVSNRKMGQHFIEVFNSKHRG